MKHHANHEVDVVIVGAGPIGLMMAIGSLLKNPHQKIVLLEKYETYQRSHVVALKHQLIEQFAKECHGDHNPRLQDLIAQIKNNRFIKTKSLESQLRALAIELGAQIETKDVRNMTDEVLIAYPNACTIIGADGTHSTVSKQLFGPDNFVKHTFDHVLQLRFEMDGEVSRLERLDSIKYMQSYGVVASEYVGKESNGKTPITLQLMISKDEYDALSPHATSKHPIKLFQENETHADKIPPHIVHQINGYLGLRLRHYTHPGQSIFIDDVKLSVNEAPATRALHVAKTQDDKVIVLAGDASLGLSYFKGLNAGIESCTKLLSALDTDSLQKKQKQLAQFDIWFDTSFAPSKINEVDIFSSYFVRPGMRLFYWMNQIVDNNLMIDQAECDRSVYLYRQHQKDTQSASTADWTPYPHRPIYWNPTLTFIPITANHAKQFQKYFVDWVKPYKSFYYVLRTLAQPLQALYHLISGSLKIGLALPIFVLSSFFHTLRGDDISHQKNTFYTFANRLLEGLGQLTLGLFLAVTIPFIPLKIGVRAIVSVTSNHPTIETNPGIKTLIAKAETPSLTAYEKTALCIDLHRKFEKAITHGQQTRIQPTEEKVRFDRCLINQTNAYNEYFSLFKISADITSQQSANDNKPTTIQNRRDT